MVESAQPAGPRGHRGTRQRKIPLPIRKQLHARKVHKPENILVQYCSGEPEPRLR